MMKIGTKWLTMIVCLLAALIMPFAVYGQELAPAQEDAGSLTIQFHNGEINPEPIVGATFRLYLAATLNQDNEWALSKQFADARVKIDDLEDSAMVRTLAAYAAANNPTPVQTGTTDESGRLVFGGLSDGLYLVIGDNVVRGKVTYTPTPFIVPIPSAEGRNLTVDPKYDRFEEKDDLIERRVLKIWEDEGYEKARPEKIEIQLLCDGAVVEEVTLNAENNWRHTWSELESGHNWQVTEKEVPEGYEVSVDQQGITFTVTNTYTPPPPPPPPETPPPSTPPSNPPKLPQTGLLWWPIPVLLAGGVLLVVVGAIVGMRRKGSHE